MFSSSSECFYQCNWEFPGKSPNLFLVIKPVVCPSFYCWAHVQILSVFLTGCISDFYWFFCQLSAHIPFPELIGMGKLRIKPKENVINQKRNINLFLLFWF